MMTPTDIFICTQWLRLRYYLVLMKSRCNQHHQHAAMAARQIVNELQGAAVFSELACKSNNDDLFFTAELASFVLAQATQNNV